MGKEEKILKEIINLEDSEMSIELLNFYSEMKEIKNDMVDVLNLLDVVAEDSKQKELMRKKILDSYNELPRKTMKLLKKILDK
ncbi:MAG: hypothetical protein ACQEQF_01765 [Bacillota bacterium]